MMLWVGLAFGQAEYKQSLRLSAGATALYGNVEQVSVNLSGHHGVTSEKLGNDVVVNGFRLWFGGDEDLRRVGDDWYSAAMPFVYVKPKVYVAGLVRYDSSQLHQLNHRVVGGAGVGWAPVRRTDMLIRTSVGAYGQMDVLGTGSTPMGPRLGVLSNGWVRLNESPVAWRYVAWVFTDPTDDWTLRGDLDTSLEVKLFGPLTLRLGVVASYDPTLPDGVEPVDLRGTVGLGFVQTWTGDETPSD